jgi:hypothetical protein
MSFCTGTPGCRPRKGERPGLGSAEPVSGQSAFEEHSSF